MLHGSEFVKEAHQMRSWGRGLSTLSKQQTQSTVLQHQTFIHDIHRSTGLQWQRWSFTHESVPWCWQWRHANIRCRQCWESGRQIEHDWESFNIRIENGGMQ